MMKYYWLSIIALAVSVAGCERTEKSEDKLGAQAKHLAVSTSSPVVVRIDGVDLTRNEVLRKAKVMLQLNMNKQRKTTIGKREWDYFNAICRGSIRQEASRAAIRHYLAVNNLVPSSNIIQNVTKAFEKAYGVRSKKLKRWHRVSDLKYMVGKNADIIDHEISDRVNYATATNAILSNASIKATDEDIDRRINDIRAFNARATATNVLVFAKATNIWRRVTANEIPFEDAAKQFSEDIYISDGCEWGMFTRDQLADEAEIRKILPTLKIGDITPPIESDGGLAILRLDPSDNPENVTFSRIFFRLPQFYDLETPEEAAHEIVQEKKRQLVNDTIKTYIGKMKIEYPDGPNIFLKDGKPISITSAEFKAIGQ